MTWSSSSTRARAQPEAAVGVGELHEVRAVGERGLREAVVVEQLLPLPDHPEEQVVQDEDLDRQLRARPRSRGPAASSGSEPSPSMPMTSSPGRPSWIPMAEGRQKPMVPRPPEVMNCARLGDLPPLRGEHLVLADAGGDDRLPARSSSRAGPPRTAGAATSAPPAGSGAGASRASRPPASTRRRGPACRARRRRGGPPRAAAGAAASGRRRAARSR